MKSVFNHIKADKIIRWSISIALILFLLHTIGLVIAYITLPPFVPVYNQLPWGDPRIATKYELFIPIILSLLFLTGNVYTIEKIYSNMPLLARVVGITTLLIAILGIIFIGKTIHILI